MQREFKQGLPKLGQRELRALDRAYESEKLERDERRGLETRAATLIAALLVLVSGEFTLLTNGQIDSLSVLSIIFLGLFGVAVVLTVSLVAWALSKSSTPSDRPAAAAAKAKAEAEAKADDDGSDGAKALEWAVRKGVADHETDPRRLERRDPVLALLRQEEKIDRLVTANIELVGRLQNAALFLGLSVLLAAAAAVVMALTGDFATP